LLRRPNEGARAYVRIVLLEFFNYAVC
jgi:hypothetical protein